MKAISWILAICVLIGGTSCRHEKAPESDARSFNSETTSSEPKEERQTMPELQTETVLLLDYLYEMAGELGTRYTVEEPIDPETATPQILYLEIVPDSTINTIDELVDKLDDDLEGVTVIRSTNTPNVVHLIADDALAQQNYVFDQTVDVQYSGLLGDLPNHLGTLLNGKIANGLGALPFPISYVPDYTTEIEIDIQDESVRNLLTDFVPQEGYSTILWDSNAYEIDGELVLSVTFHGPEYSPEAAVPNE